LEKTVNHNEKRPKHNFGRREAAPPKDLRKLSPDQVDKFVLEQREYEMKPAIVLDPVRNLLHKIIQRTWKYGFATAMQKREAERSYKEKQRTRRGQDAQAEEGGIIYAADEDDIEHDESPSKHGDSPIVDLIGRLVMTFLAGCSLLVPMLIMTFRTGQTARLVTVCVSTLLFGVIVSFSTRATNHEILAADAAYAAVLVVYVGTADTNSST
jgi:hypothetical protein